MLRAFAFAMLAAAVRAAAAAPQACAEVSGPVAPDDPRLRQWLRQLVHEVARSDRLCPACAKRASHRRQPAL